MPNASSHAGHVPQRTCVVCRKAGPLQTRLRFVLVEGNIVFDMLRRLTGRGRYVCNDNACLEGLEKWRKRYGKKQVKERRKS